MRVVSSRKMILVWGAVESKSGLVIEFPFVGDCAPADGVADSIGFAQEASSEAMQNNQKNEILFGKAGNQIPLSFTISHK
jgi:hypothetical protein